MVESEAALLLLLLMRGGDGICEGGSEVALLRWCPRGQGWGRGGERTELGRCGEPSGSGVALGKFFVECGGRVERKEEQTMTMQTAEFS